MTAKSTLISPHIPIRPDWLATRKEEILWPALPIIDPHHHLWHRPSSKYMQEELDRDLTSGHNVVATVFVQSRSMYRLEEKPHLQPVGEVEFANGVAACYASGIYENRRGCAGIVAGADLCLDGELEQVLEQMIQSGGQRLKGIRNSTAWHDHPAVRSNPIQPPAGLLQDAKFQSGARRLQKHGLSLDIWAYHTQLDEVYNLAKACPETVIIIDHLGGPLGVGPYANIGKEVYQDWRSQMSRLANVPNVHVKLGGFGLKVMGYRYHELAQAPCSDLLAKQWRPYVETLIDMFGSERCMFESNFPVDKGMYSYHVMWNAFKKICRSYSPEEIGNLFHGTAKRIYRLSLP
ncbi:putative TIM-barrel fold metal-dependent hydrolase [Advenella incenata]|uniref:Putative TIM-barrel fold metal-dependent hydrolase n=1 Tax=Advenella incenata TaxID=267800 RepID=A0A4Q7V7Y0_9BURK|nr:amidohydrolase family protein [Advenella incenata]RZT91717.1 putative TIM-barrel fold metal-dependent hydrolase [Advenella incenata]